MKKRVLKVLITSRQNVAKEVFLTELSTEWTAESLEIMLNTLFLEPDENLQVETLCLVVNEDGNLVQTFIFLVFVFFVVLLHSTVHRMCMDYI